MTLKTSDLIRAGLVLAALPLAACGVDGDPYVPQPLFGDAGRTPPPVPSPYDRDDLVREPGETFSAAITAESDIDTEFSATLDEEEKESADDEER